MSEFKPFLDRYELDEQNIIFVPYGSHVYGTNRKNSDKDYLAIVRDDEKVGTGTEYDHNNLNIHIYSASDFQSQLKDHKIHTLEAWFHPDQKLKSHFQFKLRLSLLRNSLSEKASHSFVKAKKKIDVEKDFLVGWKSLFHSLRILMFGAQIAEFGEIKRWDVANKYWWNIINEKQTDWDVLQERYKPIYNELATEFRKLAPKEVSSNKPKENMPQKDLKHANRRKM